MPIYRAIDEKGQAVIEGSQLFVTSVVALANLKTDGGARVEVVVTREEELEQQVKALTAQLEREKQHSMYWYAACQRFVIAAQRETVG